MSMIRSTFLVGFPGETEEDFAALLNFQKTAEIDWVGVFTYSLEENTPAYDMKARIPKSIARKRKAILENEQNCNNPQQIAALYRSKRYLHHRRGIRS